MSFGGEKNSKFAPVYKKFGATAYKHLLIPGRLLLLQLMMINGQSGTNQHIQSAVYGPKSLRKYAASIWSIFLRWFD